MSEFSALAPHLAFLLSALVQGIGGFGGSLVAMSLLPLVWDIRKAVGVSAVFSIFLTAALVLHLRRKIQFREVLPMIAGAVGGVPVGVYALHSVSEDVVIAALGAVLVGHATWTLTRTGQREAVGRWAAPVAGFAGGLLSGAFSTAGPPVLIYATSRAWERDTFRANLQAFFLTSSVFSLFGFLATNVVTLHTVSANLELLPALVLGGVIGSHVSQRIDPEKFRFGVLVALLLMGLQYLVRAAL